MRSGVEWNRTCLRLTGCILVASCAVSLAGAQTPELPSAPAAPAAYVDRVLENGPQSSLTLEKELSSQTTQGWPRSWRVDYSVATDRSTRAVQTQGLALSGYLDTPDYGTLSAQASFDQLRQDTVPGTDPGERGQTSRTWRIDQRAMPLNGGWLASHSAGDINSAQVAMTTQGFGRIYLPNTPIEGLSGQWQQGDALSLNASLGQPGFYRGFDSFGVKLARGSLLSTGGQMSLGDSMVQTGFGLRPAARLGAQYVEVHDATDSGGLTGSALTTRALWTGWSWEGLAPWGDARQGYSPSAEQAGGLRLQANLLHSSSNSTSNLSLGGMPDASASGAWLDSQWRNNWLQNTAGVFWLQPGLRWGTAAAASDLQGFYWRGDVATRQWQFGLSFEASTSVSGLLGGSNYSSVYGRYRFDTRNMLSSTLAMRRGRDPGESLLLTWDHQSRMGQTQWRGDFMRTSQQRSQRLGIDQQWALGDAKILATSLARQNNSDGGSSASSWQWGLLAGMSPGTGVTFDASLRGAHGNGGNMLSSNIGLNWQLRQGWSLLVQYSTSRGQDPSTPLVVSDLTAANTAATLPIPESSRFMVTLRYEEKAGRASAPIGGAPGSAAGGLRGTVYLDADNNGRRDASELGVPNITVVLDRRYVARTDSQGRYEFPAVAAGEHVIEVQTDNVPLPWSPAMREPAKTSIYVRQDTTHDFPLQRDR